MLLKRHLRTAVVALISGASLGAIFYIVDFETIFKTLGGIEFHAIASAGVLVLLNAVLALLRFRSVLRSFGYKPAWRQVVFAFTIGQVSNQIFLNVIGQSLSRAAALNSAGVPFSISVMATYWERLIAAGLLFLLSVASALFLFLNISIDLHAGGAYLLSLAGGIALVSGVVLILLIRQKEVEFRLADAPRFLLRLWPSILLTLAAHAAMLGAYAGILKGLQVPEFNVAIAAALTIVMFAAALPISFSGWGIRELSAAQALGVVGVDPTISVAGAIAIGLLGLLVTVICGAIGIWLYLHRKPAHSAVQATPATMAAPEKWNDIAIIVSAVLSAILLYFQIRIPMQHGEVTANAADILALTSLGLLGFHLWSQRGLKPIPIWLAGSLAAISLLFLLSLGVGYLRFGSNSWALLNRGMGWVIILGYVAMGASAAVTSNAHTSRLVLRAFGIAGVTVAVQQLALMLSVLGGINIPQDAFTIPLRGYAINANAFAFQMIMAAACILVLVRLEGSGKSRAFYNAAFIAIALVITYSHSRSGLGMVIILLVLATIFSSGKERTRSIKLCLLTLFAVAAVFFLPDVLRVADKAIAGLLGSKLGVLSSLLNLPEARYLAITVTRTGSDSERWLSIIEGWDLWLKHPLLGAGLGGYVQERLAAGKGFLVIHSIPVWLMAEMGLVGLLVVAVVFVLLLKGAFHLLSRPAQHGWGLGLLCILGCIAASGLVHDLFFQRSFWFLIGLYVVAGFRAAAEESTASGSVTSNS